ncbi:hypothetical protein [Mycobacterium avium]|uniref:hypothetical protein n=1 Tax=Mycobacterium avium TaxID=1764 RepID=UPI0005B61FB8|nr:hypothetical protein [Mycobacterium avium]
MTAPDLGPCVCDSLADFALPHEHSDFDPYPCAEPGCPCPAFRPAYSKTEPAENQAQINGDARNRASVTIPTGALEFATHSVTQTAEWIDSVLAWAGAGATPADDPTAVCDFADALDAIWPEAVDPKLALALTLRRLAATRRDSPARGFVAGIRRKVAGR